MAREKYHANFPSDAVDTYTAVETYEFLLESLLPANGRVHLAIKIKFSYVVAQLRRVSSLIRKKKKKKTVVEWT